MGPPVRQIVGREYKEFFEYVKKYGVLPYYETNNQRSCTDYFKIHNKEYRVYYWEGETELEEVLNV